MEQEVKLTTYGGKTYLSGPAGWYWNDTSGEFILLSNPHVKSFINLSSKVGDDQAISTVTTYTIEHKTGRIGPVAMECANLDGFIYLGERGIDEK